MHTRIAGLSILMVLACIPARGGVQAGEEPASADVLSGVPCTSFEWIGREGFSEKASMRVPVKLDGHEYWFQLDTGADATILYDGGHESQSRGWTNYDSKSLRIPNVSIGGRAISAAKIYANDTVGDETLSGTVGLDVLVGYVTIVDFPHRRFCVLLQADVPPSLMRRARWTPAVHRDGKLFFDIKVGDRVLHDIFWDSGASAFPVLIDRAPWEQLTGRSDGKGTKTLEGTSWGKVVPWIGAPALGDLEVAGLQVKRPMIYYWGSRPEFFKGWPFPATGSLGNVEFEQSIVILDIGSHPKFGVAK